MNLKVLNSIEARLKGVIGQECLEEDELYVFPDTYEGQGFHMKGVKFPIEIAFLAKDFSILKIARMEPETGTAKAPEGSLYAVEVCDGYFTKNALKEGDCWERLHREINK